MNSDTIMNAQLQNWDNFCRHHIGDWYGIWTRYSPDGKAIDSFQCTRCFHLSQDGRTINHYNHYVYADGKTEAKTFGPYQKPITTVLFLDNSFSWGSTVVKHGYPFGFEIGFRYKGRGVTILLG